MTEHSVTAFFREAAEGPKSYRWTQTYMGPEGYEDRESEVEGPLYHGGGARWRDGQPIRPGRKPNEWGDEQGKSQHVYFTSKLDTAADYARRSGGHVFQVEPSGNFLMDHHEGEFKTRHPLTVVRRLDPEEWNGHDGSRTAGRGKPRRQPGAGGGAAGAGEDAAGGAPGVAGGEEGAGPVEPRDVSFHPAAHKELGKLDATARKQVASTIDGLASGADGLQTHPLTGSLKGWKSTKASRGHRVIHRDLDDGTLHVGYVGLHEYEKAINRLSVHFETFTLDEAPHAGLTAYFRQTAGMEDADYHMQHSAPGANSAPLHDPTRVPDGGYGAFEPGVLSRAHDGEAGVPHAESLEAVRKAKGRPDAPVTIYRAAPHGVTHIHPGDWVSTSGDYAKDHAVQDDGSPAWPVLKATVPAKHVRTDGNDINEWGYNGPRIENAEIHHPGGDPNDLGADQHIGTAVHLSPDDHAFVHDQSRPVSERAQRLKDAAPHGYMVHDDPDDAHWEAYEKARTLPQHPHPPTQVIWHTKQRAQEPTGISWDLHNDDEDHEHDFARDFTHHTFGTRTASLQVTAAQAEQMGREAAAVDNGDGVMVAFIPPPEVAEQLAHADGQPASDLHVTLAYLGKVTDYTDHELKLLPQLVSSWAVRQKPVSVRTGGVGKFSNPSEDQHVLWASIDIPGGAQLHTSLVSFLEGHGYRLPSAHGWNPHMTIKYVDRHFRFMPHVPELHWLSDAVYTHIGQDRHTARLGTLPHRQDRAIG
jgi:2'-5' RNA ligase